MGRKRRAIKGLQPLKVSATKRRKRMQAVFAAV
jgi:hypothetical protein